MLRQVKAMALVKTNIMTSGYAKQCAHYLIGQETTLLYLENNLFNKAYLIINFMFNIMFFNGFYAQGRYPQSVYKWRIIYHFLKSKRPNGRPTLTGLYFSLSGFPTTKRGEGGE